jgi:hypothetical protein
MAHSLASSTGTRVDSASKHIVACKVSTDYMASLISSAHSDNAHRELQVCCRSARVFCRFPRSF